jgi:hypothetical protein
MHLNSLFRRYFPPLEIAQNHNLNLGRELPGHDLATHTPTGCFASTTTGVSQL